MAFEDFMETFQFMDYVSKPDGMGGFTLEHVPGAVFRASIYVNSSSEAEIAGRTGNKALFTIMTRKNVELEQNDVIFRQRDGRKYRITGNAIDKSTPDHAGLQLRSVTAEVIT